MQWSDFHHPDLSAKVLGRKAGDELLDLLHELGEALATRERYLQLGWYWPSQTAYRSAVYRLRKKGLVAYRRQGGRNPVIYLTEDGKASRPETLHPERHWKRKWNRIWYVLVYDVPETERGYRAVLRSFLRRMRMGCLQGSVWVTPLDIRPEYDDLVKAAALDNFAFLFEARTVLGQKPREVAQAAWDFDELRDLQADYCKTMSANLDKIRADACKSEQLVALARRELSAYLRVMRDDPLLPRAIWPRGYRGPEVLRLHREVTAELRRRL